MKTIIMGAKTKFAVGVVVLLVIAALWIQMPRLMLLWKINLALKDGAAANQEIISMTRRQAEAGDAQSQYNLAVLYEHGLRDALPQDQGQALSWYDRAANQGHAEARRVLDSYVKKGLIASPDFHGKWSPLAKSGESPAAIAAPQK